jgi:hypothetical protein
MAQVVWVSETGGNRFGPPMTLLQVACGPRRLMLRLPDLHHILPGTAVRLTGLVPAGSFFAAEVGGSGKTGMVVRLVEQLL